MKVAKDTIKNTLNTIQNCLNNINLKEKDLTLKEIEMLLSLNETPNVTSFTLNKYYYNKLEDTYKQKDKSDNFYIMVEKIHNSISNLNDCLKQKN